MRRTTGADEFGASSVLTLLYRAVRAQNDNDTIGSASIPVIKRSG